MKLYTVKDLAVARGTSRIAAYMLVRKHDMGEMMGNSILLTEKEYTRLLSYPVRKHSAS